MSELVMQRKISVISASYGRILLMVAALAVAWNMGSCSQDRQRRAALEPAVLRFNSQIKWGRGEEVARYLPPGVSSSFVVKLATLLEDVDIVGHEVVTTSRQPSGTVEVLVRFRWVRKDEGVVKTSWVTEKWKLIKERWTCLSLRTVKGEPWPLEFTEK